MAFFLKGSDRRAPLRPLAGRPSVQAGGGGNGGSGAEPLLLLRRPPPRTGSPHAGLAAGTGWRVLRRLNLQEDILIIASPADERCCRGSDWAPPSTPPPSPGEARNRDGGSRNWSPGAGQPRGTEPLRVLLPLAKVNQTLPSLGGVRRVRGSRRRTRRGGRPGRGRARWGRSLASAGASRPLSGQVRGATQAGRRMGRGCWGQRLGSRQRGTTHPGGNGD